MVSLHINPSVGVILWDIDGTLINVDRSDHLSPHKRALISNGITYKESGLELFGKTDFEVLLELSKLPNNRSNELFLNKIFKDLDLESLKSDRTSRFNLLPGVKDMLYSLSSVGWINGILTGNTYSRLQAKLLKSELINFFHKEFMFGCEFRETREKIVQRAGVILRSNHFTKIVVLGDTPRDITTARTAGFYIISVATGNFTMSKLQEFKPDLLIKDLHIGADAFINFLHKI